VTIDNVWDVFFWTPKSNHFLPGPGTIKPQVFIKNSFNIF